MNLQCRKGATAVPARRFVVTNSPCVCVCLFCVRCLLSVAPSAVFLVVDGGRLQNLRQYAERLVRGDDEQGGFVDALKEVAKGCPEGTPEDDARESSSKDLCVFPPDPAMISLVANTLVGSKIRERCEACSAKSRHVLIFRCTYFPALLLPIYIYIFFIYGMYIRGRSRHTAGTTHVALLPLSRGATTASLFSNGVSPRSFPPQAARFVSANIPPCRMNLNR